MPEQSQIDELLDRWERAQEHGLSISVDVLCHNHSELIPVVQSRVLALQAMQHWHPPTESYGDANSAHQTRDSVFDAGAEPITGYRLVKMLGRGGFGQVWMAHGPGDFPVALKFIQLNRPAAENELRSLEITRNIRHSNLLATFGSWELPGWLVIAIELAECCLLDRLDEAVAKGNAGIPVAELGHYMLDAAKGIDFLNKRQHDLGCGKGEGVQHRDIKPHNLLLVGGSVKIADFGLALHFRDRNAGHNGAMSVAYAAPEFFRGETSRHSDQYSLAVTYCQLRCGRRPFEGTHVQIMRGHTHDAPDLSMLPEQERAVVGRALAKNPDNRWPTCRAFVRELLKTQQTGNVVKAAHVEPPPTPTERPPIPSPPIVDRASELLREHVTSAVANATTLPVPDNRTDVHFWRRQKFGKKFEYTLAILITLSALFLGVFFVVNHSQSSKTLERPPIDSGPKVPPPIPLTPSKPPPDPEREIAVWALNRGAKLRLVIEDRVADVSGAASILPDNPFHVQAMDLRGDDLLSDDDLDRMAQLPNLESLRIPQTKIGDVGLTKLNRLAKLRTLDLQDTQVTGDAVARLRLALPDCDISWEDNSARMLIAPFDAGTAKAAQEAWAKKLKAEVIVTNSIGIELVLIPPGEFMMGSPDSDALANADEKPQHRVKITKPFYLGMSEVTQGEWQQIMGTEPWKGKPSTRSGPTYAANYMNWDDARTFCVKLTDQERRDGRLAADQSYTLPTEAQWEYACRGGSDSIYSFGNDSSKLGEYAWFADNRTGGFAHEVKQKKPNPFGLYDMHGSVWEWCEDWFSTNVYATAAAKKPDPVNAIPDSGRVDRGGSWWDSAQGCRSALRGGFAPEGRAYNLGFRVCLLHISSTVPENSGEGHGTETPSTEILTPPKTPEMSSKPTDSKVIETRSIPASGATQVEKYRDQAPNGFLLVGLKFTTGRYGSSYRYQAVSSVQPIYRNATGEISTGRQYGRTGTGTKACIAKDGYAIGALKIAQSGDKRVTGIRVQFMRINGDRLDPADSYWDSTYLNDGNNLIGGDGRPVVGIAGTWAKQEQRSMALLLLDVASAQ